MTQDTILFFNKNPEALPLYEAFEQKVLSEIRDVTVKVQKTQISFSNKRNFAFASLLPVRKAKERPKVYLTITFGLSSRVDSPRIDGAVEAYPNRWTHHVMISSQEEIDGELMGWVEKAAEFSAGKR
jgi:predicted transport protein